MVATFMESFLADVLGGHSLLVLDAVPAAAIAAAANDEDSVLSLDAVVQALLRIGHD